MIPRIIAGSRSVASTAIAVAIPSVKSTRSSRRS